MIDHPNFVCQRCGKIHRKVETEEKDILEYRALVWKCDLCGHPHEIEHIGEDGKDE